MSSETMRAMEMLQAAQVALARAESEEYCCAAARNQAVGKARKPVKRWATWLADRAVLQGADDNAEGQDDDN